MSNVTYYQEDLFYSSVDMLCWIVTVYVIAVIVIYIISEFFDSKEHKDRF